MIRIKRLFKSFIYAFRGLFKIFKEEQNLQIQTIAACAVLILAFALKIKYFEWALLIFTVALVILMEIVNSAVERAADMLKPRMDSYAKEIKDIMAAAVMLASIAALIIGLIIFYPYIIKIN